MTTENATRGRKNDRAGKTWLRDCARWCRENGAPDATEVIRAYASDLTGLGVPLAVEATIEPWETTGRKALQAARDAERRKLPYWCIWKPRRAEVGAPKYGPGDGWCITTFAQMWALAREAAELRTKVAALEYAISKMGAKQLPARTGKVDHVF